MCSAFRGWSYSLAATLQKLGLAGQTGGEPAGGNKTIGPVGSGDTIFISPVAWPPQCAVYRGTHLWACKTHEIREVRYSLGLE